MPRKATQFLLFRIPSEWRGHASVRHLPVPGKRPQETVFLSHLKQGDRRIVRKSPNPIDPDVGEGKVVPPLPHNVIRIDAPADLAQVPTRIGLVSAQVCA